MKKAIFIIVIVMFSFTAVQAEEDKATTEAVYNLVLKAYEVVAAMGEESFPEFNNPKGEFVHKDIYVYVMRCPSEMAAHPFAMKALKGVDLAKDTPFSAKICAAGEQPGGGWMDYPFPKPGETEPSRKVAFAIKVENTPYTVVSSIYSDSANVEELNKTMR